MIQFLDLHPQHDPLRDELGLIFKQAVSNSMFILGKDVAEFEQQFSKYLGARYCIGAANGTDAISLGLLAMDLHPGDEVIVPVNTFIATALAATHVGIKPIFMDIDEKTYNINPEHVSALITNKTKALVPVHLYGLPANLPAIKQIAKDRNLHILEDCAQAHGASINGKKVGNFGNVATFSFYPAKNLGAMGDGGAVVTNNKQIYSKLLLLRNYGEKKKYHHHIIGYNSRLDTLQAAILSLKLKYLDKWNEERNQLANRYSELISSVPEIVTPFVPQNYYHAFHLYVIRAKKRNQLMKYLLDHGVKSQIHYPIPIHLQKAYAHLNYKRGSFPVAEKIAKEILSLPLYPGMSLSEQDQIVTHIHNFYK